MYYEGAGIYTFYKEDGSAIELNENDLNKLFEEATFMLNVQSEKEVKRLISNQKKVKKLILNITKKRNYHKKEKYIKLFKSLDEEEITREYKYKIIAVKLSVSIETVRKHCKYLK